MLILLLIVTGCALCTLAYNNEFKDDIGPNTRSFLYLNLSFTITCVIFIFLREKFVVDLAKINRQVPRSSRFLENIRPKIFIESLFLFIHPYPIFFGIKVHFYNTIVK